MTRRQAQVTIILGVRRDELEHVNRLSTIQLPNLRMTAIKPFFHRSKADLRRGKSRDSLHFSTRVSAAYVLCLEDRAYALSYHEDPKIRHIQLLTAEAVEVCVQYPWPLINIDGTARCTYASKHIRRLFNISLTTHRYALNIGLFMTCIVGSFYRPTTRDAPVSAFFSFSIQIPLLAPTDHHFLLNHFRLARITRTPS